MNYLCTEYKAYLQWFLVGTPILFVYMSLVFAVYMHLYAVWFIINDHLLKIIVFFATGSAAVSRKWRAKKNTNSWLWPFPLKYVSSLPQHVIFLILLLVSTISYFIIVVWFLNVQYIQLYLILFLILFLICLSPLDRFR